MMGRWVGGGASDQSARRTWCTVAGYSLLYRYQRPCHVSAVQFMGEKGSKVLDHPSHRALSLALRVESRLEEAGRRQLSSLNTTCLKT